MIIWPAFSYRMTLFNNGVKSTFFEARGNERLSGTHKGTKPERQAALRKASEGALGGLIPSMLSDTSCSTAPGPIN